MKKNKIDLYIEKHIHDMQNKTVLITGANSGIGFEASKILASKGAKIIMACRNEEKAIAARKAIISIIPNASIDIVKYDQSKLTFIDEFISSIKPLINEIDCFVLNAGIYKPNKSIRFEKNYSATIGVNFIALMYLIEKINEELTGKSSETRIIIQGSLASYISKYKGSFQFKKYSMPLMKQYNISKLGSENIFYHFASNNDNPHLKFMLCEPGITYTGLFKVYSRAFQVIVENAMKVFAHSAKSACLSACLLASASLANGSYSKPRSLFAIRGLPKLFDFNNKIYKEEMIVDCKRAIEEIKSAA